MMNTKTTLIATALDQDGTWFLALNTQTLQGVKVSERPLGLGYVYKLSTRFQVMAEIARRCETYDVSPDSIEFHTTPGAA